MSSIELNRLSQQVSAPAAAPRQGAKFTPWLFSRGLGRSIVCLEMMADFLVASVALLLASALSRDLGWDVARRSSTVLPAAVSSCGLFLVFMLYRSRAYRPSTSLLRIKETELALRACAQTLFFAVLLFGVGTHLLSLRTIVVGFILTLVSLLAEKHLVLEIMDRLRARGHGLRKVVIYGAGYTGRRLFSALVQSPKLGLRPVAIVDDDPSLAGEHVFELFYRRSRCCQIIPGPITRDVLSSVGADLLLVAIPALSHNRFHEIAQQAQAARVELAFVATDAFTTASPDDSVKYAQVDGMLVGSYSPVGGSGAAELIKRGFDIAVSFFLVAVLWPLLLLLAVAIARDSAGPVLFRQTRVGKNGTLFRMLKFRTMRTDAPAYAYSPTNPDDVRITRLGRFLRRTSLDELPQLWNVLKGEMSLVGPRPEMPFIAAQYNDRQRQRLEVKPGVTGLWQISGDRSRLIHENVHYDLYYIKNRNLFMDIAILMHTALFAMRGT